MLKLREDIDKICDKPQDYRDMVNELMQLFENRLAEKTSKYRCEVDRIKCKHAEELEKLAHKKQLDNQEWDNLFKDHLKLQSEFKGYRQAVKDILGGEG